MGAYLYFRLEKTLEAEETIEFLNTNLNNKKLGDEGIYIGGSDAVEWEKENQPDMIDYYTKHVGRGNIKVSGLDCDDVGLSSEEILELQCKVFEELNAKYEMKYFANSCAFSEEEYYFSLEQMKRITRNGSLLSGKTAKDQKARKLYQKYFQLFSHEKKEIFNISLLKEKDKVLIDGKWRKIEMHIDGLRLSFDHQSPVKFRRPFVDEALAPFIEGYEKYIPSIRYSGDLVDIEAYVLDDGTLVYLETVGIEYAVKAISSVLMQGRIKMNNYTVESSFGSFKINKQGNKRKIIPLDYGLAHAITYHSPSIADTNFSVLIGRDDDELAQRFSAWLDNTNSLPYPKNLTNEIYEELKSREALEVLTSYGVVAIKIKNSLLEDDAIDLQEIILHVCKINGLIDKNAKPYKSKAPLPKSKYLKDNQVQKIMDTLDGMPKTYELEDLDIKPIGLKLFSPNLTLYITEADRGSEHDEYESMHTECFGYVKNESNPICSEWGYINVREYLEISYKPFGGFEQDLHFENMYIDSKGRVGTLEELENKKLAA